MNRMDKVATEGETGPILVTGGRAAGQLRGGCANQLPNSCAMNERRHCMKRIALLLFAVAMVSGVVAARAQTSTPTNEPPANLIVDPPLPDLLAQGIVWIPWRAENVKIGPVFGKDALNVSPRVGHLHIHVDDLPWLWADF